jgi:hypothetical protein
MAAMQADCRDFFEVGMVLVDPLTVQKRQSLLP